MIKISIAEQFSTTPGARFKDDGPFSGEEFRDKFLTPLFSEGATEEIEINLDGTAGYGTSFLEEAFGGLARNVGKDKVLRRLKFISDEEPILIDEINEYMNES
jgi:hypothetical protein